MQKFVVSAVALMLVKTSRCCPDVAPVIGLEPGDSGTTTYQSTETEANCSWTVQTAGGAVVEMKVLALNLSDHACVDSGFCTCVAMFVEFIDTNGSTIFRTCGSELAEEIRSSGPVMRFRFVARNTSGEGFTVSYTATKSEDVDPVSECRRGKGYDYFGSNQLSLTEKTCLAWTDVLKHNISDLERSELDGLKLTPRQNFCSNNILRRETGPWCYVPSNINGTIEAEGCGVNHCSCGASRVNASSPGMLASPHHPYGGPPVLCRWTLFTDKQHFIEMTFENIRLKKARRYAITCPAEYIDIYDFRDEQWHRSTRFCAYGDMKVQPYVSFSSELIIQFNCGRDTSDELYGFNATYKSIPKPAAATDCQPKVGKGASYLGSVSQTETGLECQHWAKQTVQDRNYTGADFPDGSLEKVQNFCRNPNNERGVWCFTTDPDVDWQYCDVPVCPAPECQTKDMRGKDYQGTRSYTKSGLACQPWQSQVPHQHGQKWQNFPENYYDMAVLESFCRNPDNSPGVWCYTQDVEVRWEFCDVPYCDAPDVPGFRKWDCVVGDGWSYRGHTRTDRRGDLCGSWVDSLDTDPFMFSDPTVEEAENFCRNPWRDDHPYCVHDYGRVGWMEDDCSIELCCPRWLDLPRTAKLSTDEAIVFTENDNVDFSHQCEWIIEAEQPHLVVEASIEEINFPEAVDVGGGRICGDNRVDFLDTDKSIIFRTCGREPAVNITSTGSQLRIHTYYHTNPDLLTLTVVYRAAEPKLDYDCDKDCSEDYGCIRGSGYDYSGKMSTTVSGKTCLPWNDFSLNAVSKRFYKQYESMFWVKLNQTKHKNYCRNDIKRRHGPWCYTMPEDQTDPERFWREDVNQDAWEYCKIPDCDCNRDIAVAQTAGWILSPGFPEKLNIAWCSWRLSAPRDMIIEIQFVQFQLPPVRRQTNEFGDETLVCKDYVGVYEEGEDTPPTMVLCGDIMLPSFTSEDSVLTITLNTTSFHQLTGFNMTFVSKSKDGEVRPGFEITDCKLDQVGWAYTGTQNETEEDHVCLRWGINPKYASSSPVQFPNAAGNQCRNPDRDPRGPWCMVIRDDTPQKEYCDIPRCTTCAVNQEDLIAEDSSTILEVPFPATRLITDCRWTIYAKDGLLMDLNIIELNLEEVLEESASEGGTAVCVDEYVHVRDSTGDTLIRTCGAEPALHVQSSGREMTVHLYLAPVGTTEDRPKIFTAEFRQVSKQDALEITDSCRLFSGYDYMGNQNASIHGNPCVRWNDVISAGSGDLYSFSHNWCRNDVGRRVGGPWCFTDTNGAWETCGIPHCDCAQDITVDADGGNFALPIALPSQHKICAWRMATSASNVIEMTVEPLLMQNNVDECNKYIAIHEMNPLSGVREMVVRLCHAGALPPYTSAGSLLHVTLVAQDLLNQVDAVLRVSYRSKPSGQVQGGFKRENCTRDQIGWAYRGAQSTTRNDLECLPWEGRGYQDLSFPDGSTELAGSSCRNPDSREGGPWCFVGTMDSTDWESCTIPLCTCSNYTWVNDGEAGNLYFPGSVEEYRSRSCAWVIETTNERVIELTFHSFTLLEGDTDICRHFLDILELDADIGRERISARLCGNLTLPLFMSLGPALTFKLRTVDAIASSEDLTDIGFNFTYTSKSGDTDASAGFKQEECLRDSVGWAYTGKRDVAHDNSECLSWQPEDQHGWDLMFPDGRDELGSFCRNPDRNESGPWCWVQDATLGRIKVRCDIEICSGSFLSGKRSTTALGLALALATRMLLFV